MLTALLMAACYVAGRAAGKRWFQPRGRFAIYVEPYRGTTSSTFTARKRGTYAPFPQDSTR